MNQSRPDHITCVLLGIEGTRATWCTRPAVGFTFVDATHALLNEHADGRLTICPECWDAMRDVIRIAKPARSAKGNDSDLVTELRSRAGMIESVDVEGRPRNVTIMREAADTIERKDSLVEAVRAWARGECGAAEADAILRELAAYDDAVERARKATT